METITDSAIEFEVANFVDGKLSAMNATARISGKITGIWWMTRCLLDDCKTTGYVFESWPLPQEKGLLFEGEMKAEQILSHIKHVTEAFKKEYGELTYTVTLLQ